MFKQNFETISEIFGLLAKDETARNKELFAVGDTSVEKRHETFRTRLSDRLGFPCVVLPAGGDIENFFATIATYYQNQSPISALMHVLDQDTVRLFERQHRTLEMQFYTDDRTFRAACLGVALGEATLAGLAARDESSGVAYSACRRTLAFSLCRATLLHQTAFQPKYLAGRWSYLRKLTGLGVSAHAVEAVLLAHALASDSSHPIDPSVLDVSLSEALRRFASYENHDEGILISTLINLYPDVSRYFDEMKGPFDGRMSAFTRVVEAIQSNSHGIKMDEIAVAFACNYILPGSFVHVGVLANLVEFYPAALIWYGFFSLLTGAPVYQQHNSGLISKLERDLLEDFSFEQRPRCDISLDELDVLSRAKLRAETIRPSQQRTLLVSLLPGVDIYTRFDASSEVTDKRYKQDAETDKLRERLSILLEEALATLRDSGRGRSVGAQKSKPRKSNN